jgi:hypothetical protein
MLILGAVRLGFAMASRLKGMEDRLSLLETLTLAVGDDGKVTPIEWATIGKRLGVFDVK